VNSVCLVLWVGPTDRRDWCHRFTLADEAYEDRMPLTNKKTMECVIYAISPQHHYHQTSQTNRSLFLAVERCVRFSVMAFLF